MSIRHGLVAGVLGNACAALVGLAVIPAYLRLLGPEGYALIGFLATLQGWAVLADLGLAPAMNRELARYSAGVLTAQRARELLRSAEVAYIALAAGVGLVVALSAWPLAVYWIQPGSYAPADLARVIALMGLVLASQWMGVLYRSCLLGLQQQAVVGVATGLVALARAGAGLLSLLTVSATIEAFLWSQAIVGAVETLVLHRFVAARMPAATGRVRASTQALQALRPFALGIGATMMLATVLTQADKLLVARYVPLEQFGYFMLAVTIGNAFSVLVIPVNNVVFPRFSELVAGSEARRLAGEYHRFSQLLAIGLFPLALLLGLFAEPFLHAWTGDAQAAAAAAPILSVWVIGSAVNGVMLMPHAAQLAHGWTSIGAAMNVIATIVLVPALAVLVPRYGAIAAAWVWVLINVGYISVGVPLTHRRILRAEQARWYLSDLAGPFAGAALASLPALAAHAYWRPDTRLAEAAFLGCTLIVLAAAAAAASPLARSVASQWLGSARRQSVE